MKRLSIVFFLIFFSNFLWSQSLKLTEELAVSTALQNNFNLKILKNQTEAARIQNSYGQAGFFPSLDLSASYNKSSQNTDQLFANGTEQSRDGAERISKNAALAFNWTVFDGLQMFSIKNQLESQVEANYFNEKQEIERVVGQVLFTYYTLALEKKRLELFESNKLISAERVRIEEESFAVGRSSKLNLLQAKVDLNSDVAAIVQQEQVVDATKLALLQILGIPYSDIDLLYDLSLDSTLLFEPFLEKALLQNFNIKALSAQIESSQKSLEAAKRARLPQLGVTAGYGYSNLESEAGFLFRNETYDFSYGVNARMGIFNGGAISRQIQQSKLQMDNAQISIQQARQEIEMTIRSVYLQYKNNLELVKLENENVAVADENSEIAVERFRIGSSNPLELREAQLNALNVKLRFSQALFAVKQAEISLYQLAGLLTNK